MNTHGGLHNTANYLKTKGRGRDTELVHMSPREIKGLQALALAHGGSLTINPDTGLVEAGFATENMACFGMGGGLLQKVNRDTQRCAFKCSAQYRDGQWYDIQKNPKDVSKVSKKGILKLIKVDGEFVTVNENEPGEDYLKVVFENGVLVKEIDFDTVRKNAAL